MRRPEDCTDKMCQRAKLLSGNRRICWRDLVTDHGEPRSGAIQATPKCTAYADEQPPTPPTPQN